MVRATWIVGALRVPRKRRGTRWATCVIAACGVVVASVSFAMAANPAGAALSVHLDASASPSDPPAGVVVSVGYADSATGLTPWLGSPDTTFIGEQAQCCATHGPDNGNAGYDGGAIEVANTGASSITVDSVTVDFGGGSSPSHFDLWGGSTTPRLPQTLAAGGQLVLTATSTFNFDTSDLFGEACHINTGVVPVVHISVDGVATDYQDDHQILNSDGADLGSCPTDVSEEHAFTVVQPDAQAAASPVNDVAPSVTAAGTADAPTTPVVGRIVSGFAGGWNASPPPTLSLQWTRCDSSDICRPIDGATDPTYIPTGADVGSALRLQVTASNASGSVAVSSAPTSTVQSGSPVAQLGHTLTGFTSDFVNNPTERSWLETATASGTTNDFAFFARGAGNDQAFTPKIYSATDGNKGPLVATGATVTVPRGTDGEWYVSNLSGLHLAAGTRYLFALDPSGSFNGTYLGAETNGESSFFVDLDPTTTATVPDAPTVVTASPGDGTVSVAFRPSSTDGGSTIVGYTATCTSSDGGSTRSGSGRSTPITVSGVTNGRDYRCTVSAANAIGPSAPSTPSNKVVPTNIPGAPGLPRNTGYWMLSRAGTIYPFGSAHNFGSASGGAVALAARTDGRGYWTTDSNGDVQAFGAAHADTNRPALRAGELVSSISATPSGNGYWLFTNRGRTLPHGDAHFFGDMSGITLNGPIIASISTPTGHGYYMVASDGGVFSFGDARFQGSMGGRHLNEPIVGLAPTSDNRGYWLVASDGGVFAFRAPFRGSLGGTRLNQSVNGMVAFGDGYLMVASDGGVFDFADKPFAGSLGNTPPAAPIIAIAAFPS